MVKTRSIVHRKYRVAAVSLAVLCIAVLVLMITSRPGNNDPSEADSVILADYKSIDIPEDLFSVSEEDISSSIDIRFSTLQPTRLKSGDSDRIEYGDLVIAEAVNPEFEKEEITVTADEEDEYNIGLQLLGLHRGDTVKAVFNNNEYNVTIKEIREVIHELTDENVKQFFNYDTIAELRAFVRQDIISHRIFEYCYSVLLSNSGIRENAQNRSERDQFINRMLNYYGHSKSGNAALYNASGAEEDGEYRQLIDSLNSFYDEYIILRELIRRENITISEEEFAKYCSEYLLQGYSNTILQETLPEYVLFDAYYDHTYEILLKYNLPKERREQ